MTSRRGTPKVDEVADRVFRLGSTHVNWYLIVDETAVTVVDTGLPRYWPQLEATLRALGRSIGDIEAVLLTHADPDHLGNAERIADEAGAMILVHDEDRPAAKQELRISPPRLPLWRVPVLSFFVHAIRNGILTWDAVTDTAGAVAGERIEVPGGPRVIHTPGHTAGSVCFAFDERDALMVGDAMLNKNPVTGREGCIVSTEQLSADHGQAIDSLSALEDLDHSTVLFGHGAPFHDGIGAALRTARDTDA